MSMCDGEKGLLEGTLAGVRLAARPEPALALTGVDGGHVFRPGVGPAAMLRRVLDKPRIVLQTQPLEHPHRLAVPQRRDESVAEAVFQVSHCRSPCCRLPGGRS